MKNWKVILNLVLLMMHSGDLLTLLNFHIILAAEDDEFEYN